MKKYLLLFFVLTIISYGQIPIMLKDINSGNGVSMTTPDMRNGFVYNNGLFFMSNDGSGKSLWYTLGTTATTTKIIPATTSTPVNIATNYAIFKNRVLFSDNSSVWITDGTNNGTYKISSIPGLTINSTFTIIANKAYFTGTTPSTGKELYQTDSIIGSTILLKDVFAGVGSGNPSQITDDKAGGLYFSANDGVNGDELWHSDGTSINTLLVKDIFPGSGGSSTKLMSAANNKLFFMANDGVNGSELWRSDATLPGTFLLNNLTPGSASTTIQLWTSYNNKFIFSHNFTSISEADGVILNNITKPFTLPHSLKNTILPNAAFYEFNNELFVTGLRTTIFPSSGNVDSVFLFKLNASVSTFTLVKGFKYQTSLSTSAFGNLTFDGDYINKFIVRESNNALATNDHVFIVSDGTSSGTTNYPTGSTFIPEFFNQNAGAVSNTTIPFISNKWILPVYSGSTDTELNTLDYSSLTFNLIKDIYPGNISFQGPSGAYMAWTNYEILNNKVYFFANDGGTGEELWVTDGTFGGTNLVLDIYPGTTGGPDNQGFGGDFALNIRKSGNCLYFVADNGINGKEPWVICSGSSGIPEKGIFKPNFILFPNPVSDKLKITSETQIETMRVTDVFGKTILYFENIDKTDFEINTSTLSQGVYFATLKGKEGIGAKKFIKQ